MFCGPALLYLGFSLIQIVIDLYKGLYNTTFIKFIVMILFTIQALPPHLPTNKIVLKINNPHLKDRQGLLSIKRKIRVTTTRY